MIKNITDFIAKSRFGKSIEGLHVTPTHYVATDSFKLIKIPAETGATEPYTVQLPKGLKSFSQIDPSGEIIYKDAKYQGTIIKDEYPKFETVVPTDKPVATITLDAEYLGQICKAFQDGKDDHMTIEIHAEHRPIVVTNESGLFALLMPVRVRG